VPLLLLFSGTMFTHVPDGFAVVALLDQAEERMP
jgi:hypothetical protein